MVSFTLPAAFCALPATCSALPSTCSFASPINLPTISFALPIICLPAPISLSLSILFLELLGRGLRIRRLWTKESRSWHRRLLRRLRFLLLAASAAPAFGQCHSPVKSDPLASRC